MRKKLCYCIFRYHLQDEYVQYAYILLHDVPIIPFGFSEGTYSQDMISTNRDLLQYH